MISLWRLTVKRFGNKVAHVTYGMEEIEKLKEEKITISFGNTIRMSYCKSTGQPKDFNKPF